MKKFILFCVPYKGMLIGALIGLITAILMLTIGFFPTLLIFILMCVGIAVGYSIDHKLDIIESIKTRKFAKKDNMDYE